MRIHRLHLRNFRGVVDREVSFPDSGIVILQGENEVGKSTMIEAFDLLLDKVDSSKAAQVRAAQPAGQDVGPSVEAELSSGQYRFTYIKQWLRSPRTELHLSTPHSRHYTGGPAHDEVRRILAESLDTALFKALRVMQSGSAAPADLSDSAALSTALDRAAGAAGHDDAGEALLQRVDDEYATYFTPTGRPTGALARSEKDLRASEAAFAEAEGGLRQLQQDVDRHGALTTELTQIEQGLTAAREQAEANEQAWQDLLGLRADLNSFEQAVQLHTSEKARHHTAAQRRSAQEQQLRTRHAALADTASKLAEATGQLQSALQANERAKAELVQARTAEQHQRRAADAAAQAVEAHHDRAQRQRLEEVIAGAQEQQRLIEECSTQLADTHLDEALLAQIDQAHQDVTVAKARQESAAARVHLEALGDVGLQLDGQSRPLQRQECLDLPVTDRVDLEIPHTLRVEIMPAASTESTESELTAARERLSELLHSGRVADKPEAHRRFDAEEKVRAQQQHAEERLQQILAGKSVGQLRAERAEVVARIDADIPTQDLPSSNQEPQRGDEPGLEALRTAKQAADEAAARARQRTSAAETDLTEAGAWYGSLREDATRLEAQHASIAADNQERQQALEAERAEASDEELQERLDATTQALAEAEGSAAELRRQLAEYAADQVEAARLNSEHLMERLGGEKTQVQEQLRDISASLRVRERHGLQDSYDSTLSDLEVARAERARLRRRADACQLLHAVLHRARDAARAHYIRPFREQVLSLGRVVYGPSLDVEVGDDLRILNRTLGGLTIDFEHLSAGAQEQLGIITRLACAAVVDPDQGVPVVIDDALGYSDPRRLAGMNIMMGALTSQAQIILLTCTPERYRGIGAATVLRLEPELSGGV